MLGTKNRKLLFFFAASLIEKFPPVMFVVSCSPRPHVENKRQEIEVVLQMR